MHTVTVLDKFMVRTHTALVMINSKSILSWCQCSAKRTAQNTLCTPHYAQRTAHSP